MDLLQTLFILAVIILIVWWALRRSASKSETEAPVEHGHEEHEPHVAHEEHAALEVEAAPEPVAIPEPAPAPEFVVAERVVETVPITDVQPDDLIIIEGIGPRISGVLVSNGVKTFAQLAAMEPDAIKAILTAVDERLGRIANPETWPQQAALAAKGDLEGLQKLQDSLKAGRVE